MNAVRPRLLLFDLDETLLGPTRRVSPANAEALRAAMAQGIRVGFATGRSKQSVQPWIEELEPNAPLILLNGGMVWDVGSETALCEHRLPAEDARAALAILAELGVHANVYLGDEIVIARRSETSRQSELKDGVPHRVVGDLATHIGAQPVPPLKILCIRESGRIEDLAERLRPVLRDGSVLVRSEPTYLEVLPPGVSKGAALSVVLEHCGIPASEVFSFGDGLNDLELLAASGLGVAMGNAHPQVRESADCVIGPNDSDSIADFLRLRAGLVSESSSERG
jgi:Cof subfamily protein (haloacid dehalogenase superfamily)